MARVSCASSARTNPPFLGGKRISTVLGNAYRDWLGVLHTNGTSNADLVAHFNRVIGYLTSDR